MRLADGAPLTRAQWSDALLKEAQQRLKNPATLFSGLMQLQGLSVRWSDLPAAKRTEKSCSSMTAGRNALGKQTTSPSSDAL